MKGIRVHRERRISGGDGFVRLSMYLTVHSSRLEGPKAKIKQVRVLMASDGRTEGLVYLQRWLRKNQDPLRERKVEKKAAGCFMSLMPPSRAPPSCFPQIPRVASRYLSRERLTPENRPEANGRESHPPYPHTKSTSTSSPSPLKSSSCTSSPSSASLTPIPHRVSAFIHASPNSRLTMSRVTQVPAPRS